MLLIATGKQISKPIIFFQEIYDSSYDGMDKQLGKNLSNERKSLKLFIGLLVLIKRSAF